MQIDRFFRTASACKPRLLTVGEALWERLETRLDRLRPGIDVHRFGLGPGDDDDPVNDAGNGNCMAAVELIPARDMTGIDHDYRVWHLFNAAMLREDIYRPSHDLIDFLAPTRAFLATTGFYGLDRPGPED